MAKKEPKNQDVLEGMNKRFNMVFAALQKNDVRFNLVFKELISVQKNQKELLEQREADSEVLDEIRGTVVAMAKAVDADAITIVRHDKRITRLEKILQ